MPWSSFATHRFLPIGSLVVAILVASPSSTAAKPDFTQSTVTVHPERPSEGDVVTFTVTVRNTGDQDAPHTEVVLDVPLESLLVDVSGLGDPVIDRRHQSIKATLDLPAGGSHTFRVRVVVPRDAGGRMLSPDLVVRNSYRGAEYYGGASVEIDTRIESDGIRLGSIRVAPAGIALLVGLTAAAILWVAVRALIDRRAVPAARAPRSTGWPAAMARRIGPGGAVVAIALAMGFWSMFAAMAWKDWRSLREWRETSCRILDSRLRAESSSSTRTTEGGGVRRTSTTPSTTYRSLLALRYDVDGVDTISTGFDTGSRLSVGGGAGAAEEFARWSPGQTVPCWYDPRDPKTVVVIRGFGGAYLFALLPLPLFLLGLAAIRTLWRSGA